MQSCETEKRRIVFVCALMAIVTLVTYWPLTSSDFVNYDDHIYVTDNPHVKGGLSWDNVGWAWRTGHGGNWHPLTWISHMFDVQFFGLKAGWHHSISLLFHCANAVLLVLLLQRLTAKLWRSALVAALFALHPLHVESVAWISERKDVLSAFFFLLTLIAYVRFARPERMLQNRTTKLAEEEGTVSQSSDSHITHLPSAALSANEDHASAITAQHSPILYALSLLLFALGLMSKPMLVTLPFVLLLLDYWPLGRFQRPLATNRKLLVEKLPFFVLAALASIVTVLAQKGGGAVVPLEVLPLSRRLGNAFIACAAYLEKMVWPADLALFYPLGKSVSTSAVVLSVVVLGCITAWVVRNYRRSPHLPVGWFWYLGMLVPVSGLVQVGMQQMADRYTYLPLIGVFIVIVWEIAERFSLHSPEPSTATPSEASSSTVNARASRIIIPAAATLLLLSCILLTRRQAGYWKDSEALFGHSVQVTPNNYVALNDYGLGLLKKGKVQEARRSFEAAIKLEPDLDAARLGLGEALIQERKYDEAAAAFSEVLRNYPTNVVAHDNLGNILAALGRPEEAVAHFEEAVRLNPDHVNAHNNLAISYKKLGRVGESIEHYRQAIRLKPDFIEALNNLAWTLATDADGRMRNGSEAVQLATRACELTRYQHPVPLVTLAAAHAEAGSFPEAISLGEQARQRAGGQGPLVERLDKMLKSFRENKAYRDEG